MGIKYHVVFTPKYRRKIDYWWMREDIRDIIRDLCKWKGVAIFGGNRHFWATGYYVSTVGLQEKALRKYIQEQEKQDQIADKISTKEYENPFKGNAR